MRRLKRVPEVGLILEPPSRMLYEVSCCAVLPADIQQYKI